LRLGDTVEIEVTRYTSPCKNIAGNFDGGDFNRMNQKTNPGWSRVYARVLAGGTIRAADPVTFSE
jgi:MOSC domain-containing protein YiiM